MAFGPARLVGLVLALAALPGCLATPPRVEFAASAGNVRAETHHEARLVADVLDELAPQVALLLPDTVNEPVEVWVQERLEVYRGWPIQREVPAFTIEGEGRIHMLGGERPEVAAALSHELVHAMLGPSWATLPPVAEEGLADWVQERLNPRYEASMRADHLVKAGAAVGGLPVGVYLDWSDPRSEPIGRMLFPEDEGVLDPLLALEGRVGDESSMWRPYEVSVSDPRLYGVGYLVVSRIIERTGLQGLHRMCQQAAGEGLELVPARWLLETADLDRDPDRWRQVIRDRFGRAELMALSRSLVTELSELLVEGSRERNGSQSWRRFLRTRPGVGLVGGPERISVLMVPGMMPELRRVWSRQRTTALRATIAPDAVSWAQTLTGGPSPPALAASR